MVLTLGCLKPSLRLPQCSFLCLVDKVQGAYRVLLLPGHVLVKYLVSAIRQVEDFGKDPAGDLRYTARVSWGQPGFWTRTFSPFFSTKSVSSVSLSCQHLPGRSQASTDAGMVPLGTPRASEAETQLPTRLLASLQYSDCYLGKLTGLLGSLQGPAFS